MRHPYLAILAAILANAPAWGDEKTPLVINPPTTPQEVWAGYDPTAEPLEMEVVKRWKQFDANYAEVYFTGMTHEGEKVRVYGIFAAPMGGKNLPAVLHIHGGGQTVAPTWLKFWNDRGYAAMTFNWGGKWPGRDKYTLWGKLPQGNNGETGKFLMATEPSVHSSSWYLWTRISRRALTTLAAMPEVDSEKLGIYGVSVGGTIVWPVAAMDKRVKAACAIYGCGWHTYPDLLDEKDVQAAVPSVRVWRSAMESESYAPLVRCPILFLNATNDHHGKMDWSFRTLALVPGEHRQAHTPRFRHHIAASEEQDLPLWMDTYLKNAPSWPETPAATVRLTSDGVPELVVKADGKEPIATAKLFYAVENRNSKNRFWRSAIAMRTGDEWVALLPVHDTREPLFAFANVHYKRGMSIGTDLVAVVPDKLGPAKATDQPSLAIEDFKNGIDDFLTTSTATDPVAPVPSLIVAAMGPGGRKGVAVSGPISIVSHKIGDPKWRGPTGATLQFDVFAREGKTQKLSLHEKEFVIGHTEYTTERPLTAGRWATFSFSPGDFKTKDGKVLKGWDQINMLELKPSGANSPLEAVYTDFRWVLPAAPGK